MKTNQSHYDESLWDVPQSVVHTWHAKQTAYCLVIPVLNEGARLHRVLTKLQKYTTLVDVLILDKGSTDGSTTLEALMPFNIRGILTLKDAGKLSAQLRMGYAYALREGYAGVVTIDGNDKDDVDALPRFIQLLEAGYDFVQASRYIEGGKGVHTPVVRDLAIRMLHAPIISYLSNFTYTDTTQGYRGYSRALLADPDIQIFRSIFSGYELLAYLSVAAPRHGYTVVETPVVRMYPFGEKVPTKISAVRGNLALLRILWDLAHHTYDPK
jgi:glycosyltransferase involved in cell wall biosynthesis